MVVDRNKNNLEECTVGYEAVSKFFGKRVSITDPNNPEQHIVGVLEKVVGYTCRLLYRRSGKIEVMHFDADNLRIEEDNDGYIFLKAERVIPLKPFERKYLTGTESLAARVTLYKNNVFGPTTVYNPNIPEYF